MLKKALCLVVAGLLAFITDIYAQVPLFPDDDSTTVIADTNTVKKIIPKKQSASSAAGQVQEVARNKVDSVIMYARLYMGNRYRRGGTSAAGFDCSGFTMTVFGHMGIKLPHTSAGQGLIGVQVNRQQIQKGDLILFRGANRRSKRIGHVGIVVSERGEPVRFIHSSTSEGVRIDHLDAAYYKSRYVKSVRIPELHR